MNQEEIEKTVELLRHYLHSTQSILHILEKQLNIDTPESRALTLREYLKAEHVKPELPPNVIELHPHNK